LSKDPDLWKVAVRYFHNETQKEERIAPDRVPFTGKYYNSGDEFVLKVGDDEVKATILQHPCPTRYFEQDEVVYHSNDCQRFAWLLPGKVRKSKKGMGAGFMITGLKEHQLGFLRWGGEEVEAALLRLWEFRQASASEEDGDVEQIQKFTYFDNWNVEDGGDGALYSWFTFYYGVNRRAYWTGKEMAVQLEEFLCLLWVTFNTEIGQHYHPQRLWKFVIGFDWSQTHDAAPPEAFRMDGMKHTPGFSFTIAKTTNGVITKPSVQKPFTVGSIVLKRAYPDARHDLECCEDATFGTLPVVFKDDERPYLEEEYYHTKAGALKKFRGVEVVIPDSFEGVPIGRCEVAYRLGLIDKFEGSKHVEDLLKAEPFVNDRDSMLKLICEHHGAELLMLVKYHCELNSIERSWCRSKWFCRGVCRFNFGALKKNVPYSLWTENRLAVRCWGLRAKKSKGVHRPLPGGQ